MSLQAYGERPLLSICVPTYNRRDRIVHLVSTLLGVQGSFEICVHVDGSRDGTVESLANLQGERLRVSVAANQGRAGALVAACKAARGKFIMIFDDDDELYLEGLRRVLTDCAGPLPAGAVGFIYHLEDQNRTRIGDAFPVSRSNFLALRADLRVRGDKKEVVLADALNRAAYDGAGRFRRVPTSLLWSRLSLHYDVLCHDVVIGRKTYLHDGMTANIVSIKRRNAYPMVLLYCAHIRGFCRRRYRSLRFLAKAMAGVVSYAVLALIGPAASAK